MLRGTQGEPPGEMIIFSEKISVNIHDNIAIHRTLTCTTSYSFTGSKRPAMDLHSTFKLFFNSYNIFAVSDLDSLILHIASSKGEVI
jgi:hypothetical protein